MRYPMIPTMLALWMSASLPLDVAAAAPAAYPAAASASIAAANAAATKRELGRLRDAERQRAQAVSGRDVPALRGLVSGEYYHVETNGRVRSKTEFLQMLERDDYEFSSYDTDDVEIRLLEGGRTALVTGRLLAQAKGTNRPREFRGRFVRLWTLQQDGWRNAMHQSTEIRTVPSQREARQAQLQ